MKVPIAKVNLTKNEINSVLEPLKNGWLVQGPIVREFEDMWSKFVWCKSFCRCNLMPCTAMQISLSALGFSLGDETIVPAFTWISTANVVEQLEKWFFVILI